MWLLTEEASLAVHNSVLEKGQTLPASAGAETDKLKSWEASPVEPKPTQTSPTQPFQPAILVSNLVKKQKSERQKYNHKKFETVRTISTLNNVWKKKKNY